MCHSYWTLLYFLLHRLLCLFCPDTVSTRMIVPQIACVDTNNNGHTPPPTKSSSPTSTTEDFHDFALINRSNKTLLGSTPLLKMYMIPVTIFLNTVHGWGPWGIDIYRPSLPAKQKNTSANPAESSRLALWTGACPFSSLRYRGFRRFVGPNFLVMVIHSLRGCGVLGGFLCQGSSVRIFFKRKVCVHVREVRPVSLKKQANFCSIGNVRAGQKNWSWHIGYSWFHWGKDLDFFHAFPGSQQDFCISRLFGSSHFNLFGGGILLVGESSIRYINGPTFHQNKSMVKFIQLSGVLFSTQSKCVPGAQW